MSGTVTFTAGLDSSQLLLPKGFEFVPTVGDIPQTDYCCANKSTVMVKLEITDARSPVAALPIG